MSFRPLISNWLSWAQQGSNLRPNDYESYILLVLNELYLNHKILYFNCLQSIFHIYQGNLEPSKTVRIHRNRAKNRAKFYLSLN